MTIRQLKLDSVAPSAPTRPIPTTTAAQRSRWPAVIVSMPFMDIDRPSIQLGLLKAIGNAQGFPVRTLHANLDFAVRIGADVYRDLSLHRGLMLGEWLFSPEAFPHQPPDRDGRILTDFIEAHPELATGHELDRLLRIRRRDVPDYLDALMEEYSWDDVRVVGFSSTFQQNTASFALARRLKQRYPEIATVFGGANFDGEMGLELVRALDFIDLAVIGEGDRAFPLLLNALALGEDPASVPGVARRVEGRLVTASPEPPFTRLDELPTPDYSEYFERAEDLGVLAPAARRAVWIPFESSRGCWWGAKHHCTFCGLNGTTMAFRSKSPDRILEELGQLARRYRSFSFEAVDNILDVRYFQTLLPALAASGADYELYYEVKANLARDNLRMMAQAGITRIQPGLESLSSHVLSLMRKGVRAAQNVNVLRWAQYYGIDVSWNILWGFPGETEQDYADQAAILPRLVHLQPPTGVGRIWMERFSPLYSDPESFGLRSRTPDRSYPYIYPKTIDLEKIAYFFDYELDDALPPEAYAGVSKAFNYWSDAKRADRLPVLTYWSAPRFVQIYDGRYPGREGTHTFKGDIAEIYLACTDRPISAAAVRERHGVGMRVEEIQEVLVEFEERGLMFMDGTLGLALALPAVGGR